MLREELMLILGLHQIITLCVKMHIATLSEIENLFL